MARSTKVDRQRCGRVADKIKDHPVPESLLFENIWKSRTRGQLVSVEESIFKQWHFGRMVCHHLYDSPHFITFSSLNTNNTNTVTQVTPCLALGGNAGIESVAALTNKVYRLLEETPQGRPAKHAISHVQRYHSQRKSRVRKIRYLSGLGWDIYEVHVAIDGTFPY